MAKVRTLSRQFMKGHPQESIPTFFVEYFLTSLNVNYMHPSYIDRLINLNLKNIDLKKIKINNLINFHGSLLPTEKFIKKHTIRGGNHFKAGDKVSIRCWLSKPYNSPQIILWDDLEVKKVYPFYKTSLNNSFYLDHKKITFNEILEIANNDGLELLAFNHWFNKPFNGQIISWVDDIKY